MSTDKASARLAVFDCDGTLVDGQAGICQAMEDAFAAVELSAPDRHQIRRIVGLSLPQAVRLLAPDVGDKTCAVMVEAYKASYRNQRSKGYLEEPLFDGIRQLLSRLTEAGWLLGVATGKSMRGLTACLANHDLDDMFVTLQTADHHPSKPHPAMLQAALDEAGARRENTVMIGDTSFDMVMARSIGVRAIGVDWGYHSPEELKADGAEAVVHSPKDLGDILI
ncbi:MAG: HAD-IA family hydrolase [Sphingomonadaceae bacterium]